MFKTASLFLAVVLCICIFSACAGGTPPGSTGLSPAPPAPSPAAGSPAISPAVKSPVPASTPPASAPVESPGQEKTQYIDPEGKTVRERIRTPGGFVRKKADAYGEFLRDRPLEPDASPVLLYSGQMKGNQGAHVAVLSMDVGKKDRQQCADAALRLRCEYLFSAGRYGKIRYHFTNGFLFPYDKYREGYRLKLEGSKASLVKTAGRSASYGTFRQYLEVLFAYAGTRSVEKECKAVDKEDMRIGDIFIRGGSPGHCVIVIDLCENPDTGEKAFLLAQSYMPAQQIHILKNPESDFPWYSLNDLRYPFETPEYTFPSECLMRMP
jgi:hypothetical protein